VICIQINVSASGSGNLGTAYYGTKHGAAE